KEDVLNPVYLYFLFKSNTDYLNSKGTGTTFKELSKSAAEKIKVPVPSLDLQNQFAAFVQQIDKSKFVLQQQLQFIKKYVIMTSWRKICFYTTVVT
ncbi:restriction endonuclease subunit S, partial [Treponema sp.]|uniref:restriction endonuclease subunit S n=1 Tax=Treponema sp. TaxID=166 RepID=UPI0025D6A82B